LGQHWFRDSIPNLYAAVTDIDFVIARLGSRLDAHETAIAERLLREFTGTVPDGQLIEEIGLAIAIHRQLVGQTDC